jgi:hypothetical protein
MRFVKQGVIFVDKKKVEREGKKTLTFVSVADPATYENETFILNSDSSANFANGEVVDIELIVEGRFSSVLLKKSVSSDF